MKRKKRKECVIKIVMLHSVVNKCEFKMLQNRRCKIFQTDVSAMLPSSGFCTLKKAALPNRRFEISYSVYFITF